MDSDKKTGVGIGNFDGVHKGHLSLLETLKKECDKRGLLPWVYTFKNHPANVIRPENPVKLIMSWEKKEETIKAAGVENVFSDFFTPEIASLSPESFIDKIIIEKFNAGLVVVGENFTFGKEGRGNAELLKSYCGKRGVEVIVMPLFKAEGTVVSSTELRKLVAIGNVAEFARLSGRLYTIPGIVEHGREVGRTLGFPTANIEQDRAFVMPLAGVYETRTKIGDKIYAGVTNVGNNPTFNLNHIVVETHILDYKKDIYGRFIEVGFVKRLRGEVKFDNTEELRAQIQRDKAEVSQTQDVVVEL